MYNLVMAEKLYEVMHTLQKVVPPIILSVGTVGNILTIIILTRHRARQYSTAIYLIALSVVDVIALYTGLLRILIIGFFKTDIRSLSPVSCKAHKFVVHFSTHCSSWLVCAVTLERVLSVWFPHRIKSGCHPKSAFITVCGIAALFFVFNSHFLFGYDLEFWDFDNTIYCEPIGENYIEFIEKAWPWIDMALLFLIPFVVIMLGNILIVIRVKLSQRLHRRSCPNISQTRRSSGEHVFFLTATLVTLNIVFVVCVAPIAIYVIGQYTWWPYTSVDISEMEWAVSDFIWEVVNLLNYANYGTNFFLYVFCGSKFRQELLALICRYPRERTIIKKTLKRNQHASLSTITDLQLEDINASKINVDA